VRRVTNPRALFVVATSTAVACSLQADLGGEVRPVGGQLAGLTPGETITLEDNVGDILTLSSNGTFVFPTAVASGASYAVTIRSNPSSPIAQTCALSDPSGTVQGLPITSVRVNCDLLAFFPFSGNANDVSGYDHDAVVDGANLTTDRSGNADSAYAFAGNGSIQAAMPAAFLPSGDEARTLTAWLMPVESTKIDGIVYWGSGNCTGLMSGLGDYGDKANFWGGCDDYASIRIPIGSWTFVAIVYAPTAPTSITFYVDDQSATGTVLTTLATAETGNLVMGADLVTGVSFTGSLDSIRVYGHALTAAEVQSIFTSSDP
jgi:Concanavalin A-like lectin/glucanases superfamily